MQQQQIQYISSAPSESTLLSDKGELKKLLTKSKRWEILDTGLDVLSFFLSLYSAIFVFAYKLLSVKQFMVASCSCGSIMTIVIFFRCCSRKRQQKLNARITDLLVGIEVKEKLNALQLVTLQRRPCRDIVREEPVQSFGNSSVNLEQANVDVGDLLISTTTASGSYNEHDPNRLQHYGSRDMLFSAQNPSRTATTVRFDEIPQSSSPSSSEESFESKRNKGPNV